MTPAMYRRLSSYSPEYQLIDENENYSWTDDNFEIGSHYDDTENRVAVNFSSKVSLTAYSFVKVTIAINFSGRKSDSGTPNQGGRATLSIGSRSDTESGLYATTLSWNGGSDWFVSKSGQIDAVYYVKGTQVDDAYIDEADAFGEYDTHLLYPFQIRSISSYDYPEGVEDIEMYFSGRYRIEGVPK